VTRPFVDGWHWTTGLVHARNQTAQLATLKVQVGKDASRIADLQAKLASAQAAANWRQQNPQYKSVTGSVIIQPQGLGSQTSVMLGIGSDQGVAVNDAVVAPISDGGGLVGRVKEVTGGTATVQTLLDPTTGVTAEIQGASGAVGTIIPASGTPGELTMVQVPKSVRVRKGDMVITTGSSGRLVSLYPDGIPIGRVSQVTIADSALTMEIQVTPFVDFSNPDVMIVLETH
jgi:rod shape-determining protein MreC